MKLNIDKDDAIASLIAFLFVAGIVCLALGFASCSNVKKLVDKTHAKSDSSFVKTSDSAAVKRSQSTTETKSIEDYSSVEVETPENGVWDSANVVVEDKASEFIRQVVKSLPKGSKVKFTKGNNAVVTNASTIAVDSIDFNTTTKAEVKKDVQEVHKDITRKPVVFKIMYIGAFFILVIAFIIFIYVRRNKIIALIKGATNRG